MEGDVTVREVVDREFVGVSESDDVVETVELMLEEEVESVVVMRGAEPVGVVTERDVLSLLVEDDPAAASVDQVMTQDVPTVDPGATLAEAASVMSAEPAKRLLVTEGGEPVGFLTEHDLVSTSPFGRGPGGTAAGDARDEPLTSTPAVDRDEPQQQSSDVPPSGSLDDRAGAGSLDEQSICEACGGLARDLSSFNGQLLCGDCRDI